MPDGERINFFRKTLRKRINEARRRCNPHIGTRLLQMIAEYGELEAVKRLMHDNIIQSGLTELWECKCLDLSVEKLVIEFSELFTPAEVKSARQRLEELGYHMGD